MMKKMIAGFAGLLALILMPVTFGQHIDYDHLNWVEKEGVIRSINLVDRTAVISGYRYTFGHVSGLNQPTIELVGGTQGALELLKVGMKVQFHFVAVPDTYRRMLYIRQLPDDAWQDNHELSDAHPF